MLRPILMTRCPGCGRAVLRCKFRRRGCSAAAQSPELAGLRDKIEQALMRAGLPPEPRRFAPHVTLARLRDPPLDKLRDFLVANTQFRADPLPVENFSLIASFQTKSGSVYEEQADYPLLG